MTAHVGLVGVTRAIGLDARPETFRSWSAAHHDQLTLVALERLTELAAMGRLPVPLSLITDQGLRFLVTRTHLLRYTASPELAARHDSDLRRCVAVAAAVGGATAIVQAQELEAGAVHLLEGTNLVLLPEAGDTWELVLDGAGSEVRIAGERVQAEFRVDRVIVGRLDCDAAVTLEHDDHFIYFYDEDVSSGQPRRVLTQRGQVHDERLKVIGAVRRYLEDTWPYAWACISELVLYLNWSNLKPLVSGRDTREHAGSVRLNARSDLTSFAERVAWLASGLYHEAKHIQFYETFRPLLPPGVVERSESMGALGPDRPQVPCAWRGVPSARSLPEHLLSLHAFVPGMTVCLSGLAHLASLSEWTRAHIAMDMRGINGAVGCLELADDLLTPAGRLLADVIRGDYVTDLVPRLLALGTSTRELDESGPVVTG